MLHTFRGGKDGSDPAVGMIMDTSGNLFGTTDGGGCTGSGRACCASDGGCGTVFELSKGREKVLYAFRRTGGDRPGALLLGPQGQLYGTTQLGGTKRGNGYGVVFELQP